MNKKILGLLLALCLVIGLLPAASLSTAKAEATSATVTLFGTAVTVDTDDTTTDIPAAYYWANGAEEGAAPVAATADAWNYAFTIVDGIPTVTIKNATYDYDASFLTAKFDGKLKVAYEGTNNINVLYNASSRYFISFASATNSAGKGELTIAGADNAVMNVIGGAKGGSLLSVSNKAYLVISGGTLNLEKTNAGGVNPVISAAYAKTTINNATLNVKHLDGVGGKHPLVTIGNGGYGLTINNSNVTLENNGHTGLCMGVFQSNMNGVLYPADLTINGDSNVKITNSITPNSKDYSGVGIWARKVIINGGSLEVEAKKEAVHITSTDAVPDLTNYEGEYAMYTEKDGAAVTTYTATPYFKVASPAQAPTTEPTTAPTTAPTTEPTTAPTTEPTTEPTTAPTEAPTTAPTTEPTTAPTTEPTTEPTTAPTEAPTTAPTEPPKVALEKPYTVKIDGITYTITNYDDPVYSVNTTKTGYFNTVSDGEVTNSVTAEYIGQAIGGDESNYNVKLVWLSNENRPTLILRNAIVDNYNEDLGKWRYSSATNKNYVANPAIYTGADVPLKIAVVGGESLFQTYNGIHYQSDLSIEGFDNGSLKLWTSRNGIIPSKASSGYANAATHLSGNELRISAKLTVSMGSFANGDNSNYIIRVIGADMYIFSGAEVVTEYRGTAAKAVSGIGVLSGGNLRISGGSVYAASYNTINLTGAAYQVDGYVYISGGTVKAYSQHQSGIRAKGITIYDGNVEITAACGGLVINNEVPDIYIMGGTIEIQADRPIAYNDTEKSQAITIPVLNTNAVITAGATKEDAQLVADANAFEFKTDYVKIEFKASEPTTPSTPSEPSTEPSTEPTTQPTTPNTEATQGGQNPGTGDSGIAMFVAMMLIAMFGIVATVAFGKKRAA